MLKEQGIGYLEPRFVNEKNIADLTEKEAGELRKKLGDIKRGKSMTLDVALFWYPDANLDADKTNDYDYNKYANRVGEVDWVFYFEGHDYPDDNPKTGDYIIMGAATAMVLSGAALAVLLISKRRKNRK